MISSSIDWIQRSSILALLGHYIQLLCVCKLPWLVQATACDEIGPKKYNVVSYRSSI